MASPCIETYIKKKDPELFEVLEDLCMGGLKPRFGRGVTLFMPTGDFRKKIVDLAETDPEESIKLFMACVLSDCYPTLADLHKAKSTGISNRMSPAQEVEIAVTGTEGKLSNGSTVKKSDFKPMASRSNLMVYTLEGPMPTNGKPAKHLSNPKSTGKGKGDKNAEGGVEFSASRYVYAKRVEEDYCLYASRSNATSNNSLHRNSYADAVASLVTYLSSKKETDSECSAAYSLVHCTIDHNPVTSFYLLFEPYNTSGKQLISDTIFADFVKSGININSFETINKFIESDSSSHKDYITEVNSVRDTIFNTGNITAPMLSINEYYTELSTKGSVKGVKVLCPESVNYYSSNSCKRQAQDEFRMYACNNFAAYNLDTDFNVAEFKDFVRDCQHKFNFSDCEKQTMFNNSKLLRSIKPRELYFSGPHQFVRSTNFLYVPWNSSERKSFGDVMNTDGNPTDTTIVNYATLGIDYLSRSTGRNDNYAEIESCVAKIMTWCNSSGSNRAFIEDLKNTLNKVTEKN